MATPAPSGNRQRLVEAQDWTKNHIVVVGLALTVLIVLVWLIARPNFSVMLVLAAIILGMWVFILPRGRKTRALWILIVIAVLVVWIYQPGIHAFGYGKSGAVVATYDNTQLEANCSAGTSGPDIYILRQGDNNIALTRTTNCQLLFVLAVYKDFSPWEVQTFQVSPTESLNFRIVPVLGTILVVSYHSYP